MCFSYHQNLTKNVRGGITKVPEYYKILFGNAVNFYNAQGQVASRQNYVDHVPTQGYIYYDAHGDAKNVRDGDLNVIAEYQYNLYGKEEKATGNFDNPFRYTGQYYDSESGMYYLRARFYDPDLKRFISEDTHWNTGNSIFGDKSYKENEIRYPSSAAMMQSGNLYGYCAGNPVNGCDQSGEVAIAIAGIALSAGQVAMLGGAIAVIGLMCSAKFRDALYQGLNTFHKNVNDALKYAKGKAKAPSPPSKLKNGNNKVKTPDTHPGEFKKNKDGSYTHKKTGWNFKKGPAHGGEHWDASPSGKNGDYVNVNPNGTIR